MSDVPTRKTLTASDGVAVSYLVEGEGPTLLLLHGFVSSARGWWRIGAAQRLSETHRVLAPDIRGHGESDKPTEAPAYGRRLLADLVELLDREGAERADLAGFSMGAELALAFAVQHSHRVASLTLAGSGWSPEGIVAEYRKWFETLLEHARSPDALATLIEGVPDVTGLSAEAVAGLPMPVRGIIGELDDERPYMERISEARPDFQPHLMPGLDHLGSWRSPHFPDLLARAVNGEL